MTKEFLNDELSLGMHKELVKQASGEEPNLVKAAECLHAALEILEEQGLETRADQVLQILEKIGTQAPVMQKKAKIESVNQLMQAGVTQNDLKEFAKGNPRAVAKLNLTLRKLGLSEHEIGRYLGHGQVMSEDEARKALSPNEPGSILEFQTLAPQLSPAAPAQSEDQPDLNIMSLAVKKKPRNPGRPDRIKDWHTKGLTPDKQIKNILDHGTQFNMADDGNYVVDIAPPVSKSTLSRKDMLPGFEDLLDCPSFDIDASDDELLGLDANDTLEVSDNDIILEDFEDERD